MAAFLAGLHHSRRFRPSIVVCPATVLRQWLRELRCWYPPFRVVVLHESQRTGHLPRPPRECALLKTLGYLRVNDRYLLPCERVPMARLFDSCRIGVLWQALRGCADAPSEATFMILARTSC